MAVAATTTFLICAGTYLGLFSLMWVPVYLGNEGWLFLYPLFLLAWIPIELGAACAIALVSLACFKLVAPKPGEAVDGWPSSVAPS